MGVSPASDTTFCNNKLLAVLFQITYNKSRFFISDYSSNRDVNPKMLSVFAITVRVSAVSAVLSGNFSFVSEIGYTNSR